MTALIDVQIEAGDETGGTMANLVAKPASLRKEGIRALIHSLQRILSGARTGKVTLSVESTSDTTKASETITVASHAAVTGNYVQIGSIQLTEGVEWSAGADAAADATAIAAAINAHASLVGIVSASAASAVVTVTAVTPGRWANLITLATDDVVAFTLGGTELGGGSSTSQSTPRTWTTGVA